MKNKSRSIIASVIALFTIIIIAGIFIRSQKLDKFKESGIETSATITDKVSTRELKVSGNRKYKKYIEVTFFTQEQKTDSVKNKKIILKDENGNYTMNLDKYKVDIGKFIKTEIEISSSQMKKLKKGDKVQIVYLPKNPENAILKEDIE